MGPRALRLRPPLSLVITQVCREAKLSKAELLRPRAGRGSWARGGAMTVAWEMCGLTQRDIGRAFGVGPYAVAKAVARFGDLAARTPSIRKRIERIKSNVQT